MHSLHYYNSMLLNVAFHCLSIKKSPFIINRENTVLTNTILYSIITTIKYSKEGAMSAIDLIILGMIKEKPMSAYDLQKSVEYRHISKWVKISTPSVYKKVITLEDKGYIKGKTDNENSTLGKVIYSITDEGNDYFISLMKKTSEKMVNVFLDFNAVIVNLNNIDKELGLSLAENISKEIDRYYSVVDKKIEEREHIPFTGKTILKQQLMVGKALKEWSDEFIKTYRQEGEK